jgi:hypothetical protein
MDDLTYAKYSELFWEQPKGMKRSFELTAGGVIYGRLEFPTAFSTLAQAAIGIEQWSFKRLGCLSPHVKIRQANSRVDLGTFYPHWTGTEGEIQFSAGGTFYWKVANFWATRFILYTSDGQELITYLSRSKDRKFSNLFKLQAQVVIAPEAWQMKVLSILVLLGWYLVVLHHEDSSATAAVASTSILY